MKRILSDNFVKWIKTAVLVIINILLWAVPSNVVYLIAQNRDVLLGRYGVTRLTWMLILIPITLIVLYFIWSNEADKKKRRFQVVTLTLSIIIPLFFVDLFMRLTKPKQYIMHRNYYHLAPDKVLHGTFHDAPENAFTYPNMRPGYPDIEYTLTTDKRGFRNETSYDKYDIVVLGDSFAEGSNVPDDQIWAYLLAQKSNLTVCNLGMAAGHPGTYLETLKKFGVNLSPKLVLCMVYEGNDFRDSNFQREDTFVHHISNYFKRSPLRLAIEKCMINSLGSKDEDTLKLLAASKNRDINHPAIDALSWLPVAVPEGPEEKFYAFTVKSVLADFQSKDTFLHSKSCEKAFACLHQIKKLCDTKNIHLIIVFAPDKPHILLPLIRHNVSPDKLRSFMALRESHLPASEELMDAVLARVDIRESEVKEFCRRELVGFVSLTEPLREGVNRGQQLYFTYDDHWTPIGHEVAADTILRYVNGYPLTKNIIDKMSPRLKTHASRIEN